MIFVPSTPGLVLQKEYQKEVHRQGYRIKVVEKSGTNYEVGADDRSRRAVGVPVIDRVSHTK